MVVQCKFHGIREYSIKITSNNKYLNKFNKPKRMMILQKEDKLFPQIKVQLSKVLHSCNLIMIFKDKKLKMDQIITMISIKMKNPLKKKNLIKSK